MTIEAIYQRKLRDIQEAMKDSRLDGGFGLSGDSLGDQTGPYWNSVGAKVPNESQLRFN